MTNAALRAEEARDLRAQLGNLEGDEDEMQFMDTSPRRRVDTIYSMETGEAIHVLRYHLKDVMEKRRPDGSFAFTADKGRAPAFRPGTTKCFMAKDSPDRATLDELGIVKVCPAEHLQNAYAAQRHAEHKHGSEWRAFQAHLEAVERENDRDRQDRQIEAMMALAGQSPARRRRKGEPPEGGE